MNCLYFIRKSDRSFHSVLSNYSRLISGQIARILTHSHRGLIQCQPLSSHKLGKHLDSSPHLPFLLGLPGLIRAPPFWGDYQYRCGLSNSTRLLQRAVNSTRLRAVHSALQPWFVTLCIFGEFNKQSKPELVSEQPRKLCNVAQYELKMATKHVEIASEDAVPSASAEFCTDVFDNCTLKAEITTADMPLCLENDAVSFRDDNFNNIIKKDVSLYRSSVRNSLTSNRQNYI